MHPRPDNDLLELYKRWATRFAWTVLFIGILVLAGWAWEIELLKRPDNNLAATHPLSAISFILCCISFLLLAGKPGRNYKKIASYFLASLVLIIALAKITGSISGGWNIDRWLFEEMIARDAVNHIPAGIALNSAICFLLSSCCLLLQYYQNGRYRPVQYMALFIFFLSFFSIIGYLYRVPEFYSRLNALPMALHTAIAFLLFSMALLLVNPSAGIMNVFSGKLEGSLRSRILIPAVFIVPTILGGLRLLTHYIFPVSVELGVTLLIMTTILVFTGLMWVNIRLINKRDLEQKKTEEKFRGLLEAAPDAIVIAGEKGIIQLVNAQTEKMFGYKREELIGEKIELLMPGRYRDTHIDHRTHYFTNPKSRGMGEGLELFGRKKDGAEFFIEISLSPLQTEEGTLVSAAIRDITKRKKAEEKFRGLLEAAPDAIVIAGENGRIQLVNAQAEKMFGYKREELVGEKIEVLIPERYRGRHSDRYSDYFNNAERRTAGKVLEIFGRKKNGSEFSVEISLSPLETEEGTLVSAAIRDITARKKAEEKFRGLLEAAPDAIVIAGEDGVIQLVNAQTEKMFGYNREELVGRKIEMLMPGRYHDTHLGHRTHYFGNPKSRGMGDGLELFGRKKDGTEFFVEISLSPLETGEGLLVSAAIRDITTRKSLETRLKQFNKELEQEVKLKTSELTDMLERISDSFVALDKDFHYTYLNKKMQAYTGKDSENLIGKTVWEAMPGAAEQTVYQAARKAMAQQTYVTETYYDNRHNRWNETHIYPSPKGLSVFIRDITERKKAEEQQSLLASIVDSTDVAIISKTLDGLITSWNHGAEVLFGFMANETIGKHVSLVFRNDLSNEESFITKKIKKGEFVDEYETERTRKDGATINISLTVYPIRSPEGIVIASSQIARNITERKKAEARIREAERRYQATLDSMIEGCQIIDFNWRYVYINPVAARQGHSDPGKLLGRSMMEAYPGIEHTALFAILKRCMENRSTEQIDNEFVYADGTSNWFELRIQPSPEGLFILSIDITERKKSEEKIQVLNHAIAASERRFRGMIENGNDLVVLADDQMKPFYRSPNFERVTGWTPAELDEKGPAHFIEANDLLLLQRTFQVLLKNPGKAYPVSFRLTHKDGRQLWMEGMTTNLLHEEAIKAVVSNLRDVSQRKQDEIKLANSERIYKTIASNIPGSVIILFDKQHRYLLIEGDLMERFGYSKQHLIGKLAGEALPPEVYDRFKTGLDRVFTGEAFTVESKNPNLDTLTRFVPIRDEEQQVSRAMLVVIDITELKNAERALADLNHDLEHKVAERTEQLATVNRELEAFTYSVSHDLRAPLRIIDGFADILISDYTNKLDEEGNRTLAVIKTNAQRMGQLIDDLLNLSRLGRKELQFANVNMDQLVHAVIEEQQMMSKFKIPIVCQPLLPVRCDSSLLRQVWANLVSNAIKYSSKKMHPEIAIGSYVKENSIIYFIKDNGVGFDMKYAAKLFGVFQRLHKQTEFEGTGVGLALVQRIINKHGGKIWAEAEPGKGATFSFSLPEKNN